jgi:hypothetical protein
LTLGQFVEKYSLQDIAYVISSSSRGHGKLTDELMLYVFQRFSNVSITEFTVGNGLLTARHNNSELYAKAGAELGSSALVDSEVIAAQRPANRGRSGVRLIARTPMGKKLILASQVLIRFPLTLGNMSPLGLDRQETGILGQFSTIAYYACLVTNTGLPAGSGCENVGTNTSYGIPNMSAA